MAKFGLLYLKGGRYNQEFINYEPQFHSKSKTLFSIQLFFQFIVFSSSLQRSCRNWPTEALPPCSRPGL